MVLYFVLWLHNILIYIYIYNYNQTRLGINSAYRSRDRRHAYNYSSKHRTIIIFKSSPNLFYNYYSRIFGESCFHIIF